MSLTSGGTLILGSGASETEINCGILDINATGAVTLDTTSTIGITSVGQLTLGSGAGETEINCGILDINATGAVTLDTTSTIDITSVGKFTLGSGASETEINCGLLDINATGNITMDGGTIAITATGVSNDIRLQATDDIETTSDTITFTTTSNGGPSIRQFSGITTGGVDFDLRNPSVFGYLMRLSETASGGLTLNGVNNGINTIKSNGGASTLKLDSAGAVTIDSVTTTNITAVTDVNISATDVSIMATGSSNGTITIAASQTMELTAPGFVEINKIGTGETSIGNTTGLLTLKGSSVPITGATTCSSTLGVTGVSTLTGGFTSSASSNMNHNFLIQQNSYTQPMASTSQLGYTDTETTITNPMSGTLAERSNFNLPSKGVWLIICGYEFSSNTTNTIETKQVVLSKTTASSTAAAPGLTYLEQIDETATSTQARQRGTITGVVSVAAVTTIYVNARSIVDAGTNTALETNISWTRIG